MIRIEFRVVGPETKAGGFEGSEQFVKEAMCACVPRRLDGMIGSNLEELPGIVEVQVIQWSTDPVVEGFDVRVSGVFIPKEGATRQQFLSTLQRGGWERVK